MTASVMKRRGQTGTVKWRLHTHFEVDRHVPSRIDVTPNAGGDHDERAVLNRTIESDRLYASSAVLDGPIPAVNGCFTARSLARMYAALAGGGVLDGERFLSTETLRRATEIQGSGIDIVVGFPMHWRLGYHLAATTKGIIPNGFGHFGYGGSGGWADPDNDLAVAFVCNRVAGTPFGDLRFLRVGAQARAAAMAR